MPGIVPTECTCSHSGTCRYCKMIAWGISSGVTPVAEIIGPRASATKTVYLDAADKGDVYQDGRRNSARAKRRARLTRIETERKRSAAALEAKRLRRNGTLPPERARAEARIETMLRPLDALDTADLLADRKRAWSPDARRRVVNYLMRFPCVEVSLHAGDRFDVSSMLEDLDEHAHMSRDEFRRFRCWLNQHHGVLIRHVEPSTPAEDDYINKVERPHYLTACGWKRTRED